MQIKNIAIWIAAGAAIIVGGAWFLMKADSSPSKYDDFTKCLKDKGAIFYGAFWCRHCQNQKKMFGSSEKFLPYVECSTPDGRSQLPLCNDKKISGYPTWEFADGSRESGEVPLETLSKKTSCPLRQSESEVSPLPK